MLKAIALMIAVSLPAAASSKSDGSDALRDAQARSSRADVPFVLQAGKARRTGHGAVTMQLSLWSSSQRPVLLGIPVDHAGWVLSDGTGSVGQGGMFATPNRASVVNTGTSGRNGFLVSYDAPVVIPVIVNLDAFRKGRASFDFVFLVRLNDAWVPQHVSVANVIF